MHGVVDLAVIADGAMEWVLTDIMVATGQFEYRDCVDLFQSNVHI
jgi:hypothetical protein